MFGSIFKKHNRIAFQIQNFLFRVGNITEGVLDFSIITHADLYGGFTTGTTLWLDLTSSIHVHPLIHSFHFDAMPTIRQENEPST
jgi:hypothetical protein